MKTCILNLATTNSWYTRGQTRLIESLRGAGEYKGDIQYWIGENSIGSPSHKEVPYAFKTYALKWAKDSGYDIALWLDCSVWAIKPVQPVLDYIAQNGHLFEGAGWNAGQWTHDGALQKLGVTRDEAVNMPLFSAGFTGLDFRKPKSVEFLEKWHKCAQDGVTFPGSWNNNNKECSEDSRCLGHRHDMSVAAVLANRLDMKIHDGGTFFAYAGHYKPETQTSVSFLLQGM